MDKVCCGLQRCMISTKNFTPQNLCYNSTLLLIASCCIGIFHNVYDGLSEDLKHQVLTAIIKELAKILKVDVEVILANKAPTTVKMVCVLLWRYCCYYSNFRLKK